MKYFQFNSFSTLLYFNTLGKRWLKNGSFGFLRLACALEKPNVPFERWQKLFSRALAKNKKYISSIIFIRSVRLACL